MIIHSDYAGLMQALKAVGTVVSKQQVAGGMPIGVYFSVQGQGEVRVAGYNSYMTYFRYLSGEDVYVDNADSEMFSVDVLKLMHFLSAYSQLQRTKVQSVLICHDTGSDGVKVRVNEVELDEDGGAVLDGKEVFCERVFTNLGVKALAKDALTKVKPLVLEDLDTSMLRLYTTSMLPVISDGALSATQVFCKVAFKEYVFCASMLYRALRKNVLPDSLKNVTFTLGEMQFLDKYISSEDACKVGILTDAAGGFDTDGFEVCFVTPLAEAYLYTSETKEDYHTFLTLQSSDCTILEVDRAYFRDVLKRFDTSVDLIMDSDCMVLKDTDGMQKIPYVNGSVPKGKGVHFINIFTKTLNGMILGHDDSCEPLLNICYKVDGDIGDDGGANVTLMFTDRSADWRSVTDVLGKVVV